MVTEWRNWGWIASAIATGAKREVIADYLDRTECRYCHTVSGCGECPLYDPDPETWGCAGGHYAVVEVWAFAGRYEWRPARTEALKPTRAEALRSARIIAEVTEDDCKEE